MRRRRLDCRRTRSTYRNCARWLARRGATSCVRFPVGIDAEHVTIGNRRTHRQRSSERLEWFAVARLRLLLAIELLMLRLLLRRVISFTTTPATATAAATATRFALWRLLHLMRLLLLRAHLLRRLRRLHRRRAFIVFEFIVVFFILSALRLRALR